MKKTGTLLFTILVVCSGILMGCSNSTDGRINGNFEHYVPGEQRQFELVVKDKKWYNPLKIDGSNRKYQTEITFDTEHRGIVEETWYWDQSGNYICKNIKKAYYLYNRLVNEKLGVVVYENKTYNANNEVSNGPLSDGIESVFFSYRESGLNAEKIRWRATYWWSDRYLSTNKDNVQKYVGNENISTSNSAQ